MSLYNYEFEKSQHVEFLKRHTKIICILLQKKYFVSSLLNVLELRVKVWFRFSVRKSVNTNQMKI